MHATDPTRFPSDAGPVLWAECLPGLRVLVVEDDTDTASTLSHILRMSGHAVDVACSGPEGIEAALRQPPDVLLLDLALPGLDGWQVASRLRQASCGPKRPLIIALSGYARDEDRRKSAEAGIDLHLVKPMDPAAVLAILHKLRLFIAR